MIIMLKIICLPCLETEKSISFVMNRRIIDLLFSQSTPPYKNEHEHLKPDNVFTHRPCLPHIIFAKQKSRTNK